MNRIDEYIDNIYKKFDSEDEETMSIKEEIKYHLYEEVQELKRQGLNEEESIDRAISNFGQDNDVAGEMNTILKIQYNLPKSMVKVILIIYIIGCIFRFASLPNRFFNADSNFGLNSDKNTTMYVLASIRSKLENRDLIDENVKKEITSIIDEFNAYNNNGLCYVKLEKQGKIYYEYKNNISEEFIKDSHNGVYLPREWSLNYKITESQEKYDNKIEREFQVKRYNAIPSRLVRTSEFIFILLWILLSVSYIKMAYIRNVISKKYIIFFLCASALIIVTHFMEIGYSPYGSYVFYSKYTFLVIAILAMLSKVYNKHYYDMFCLNKSAK